MPTVLEPKKKKISLRLQAITEHVDVRIANTFMERLSAFRLGYNEYVKKKYIKNNNAEMLIHKYDLRKDCFVINAYKNNKLAGTMSTIINKKLPMENTFENIHDDFKDRKLAELSRLAIAEDFKNDMDILLSLINWSWIYAHCVMECDDWVVQVNPRHVGFYQRFLKFNKVGEKSSCDMVLDAPAVLIKLSLNRVDAVEDEYKFISRGLERELIVEKIKKSLRIERSALKLIKGMHHEIKKSLLLRK